MIGLVCVACGLGVITPADHRCRRAPKPARRVNLREQMVDAYRAERERQLTELEEQAGYYDTEIAELMTARPPITFQKWLLMSAGKRVL